jgi:hypothetical protein
VTIYTPAALLLLAEGFVKPSAAYYCIVQEAIVAMIRQAR